MFRLLAEKINKNERKAEGAIKLISENEVDEEFLVGIGEGRGGDSESEPDTEDESTHGDTHLKVTTYTPDIFVWSNQPINGLGSFNLNPCKKFGRVGDFLTLPPLKVEKGREYPYNIPGNCPSFQYFPSFFLGKRRKWSNK